MKKYFILLLSFFLFISCQDSNDEKKFISGVISIDDVAEIMFPEGVFSKEQKVKVETSESKINHEVFLETMDLFRATNNISYFIKVTCETLPMSDDISAKIKIPDKFISLIPDEYGIELFAQVYQDGGEEILDNFEILESSYDEFNHILHAKIPSLVFTDKRESGLCEAVLTIAATPGVSNIDQTRSEGSDGCQAFGILCPLGNACDVTSPFQPMRVHPVSGVKRPHFGTDYRAKVGSPVYSVSDGKIERVKLNPGGYGLYMVVRHDNGSATLYAHLSKNIIKEGTVVKKGQKIAESGGAKGDPNSGSSTGPHLHFEYVPNGQIIQSKFRIDPQPCIEENFVSASISIRDNGNWADDAFEAYINSIYIGKTDIGAANTISLNNLISGKSTLTIKCIVAPDNVGTLEIILNNGITFANGDTMYSGILDEGQSKSFEIIIPKIKTRTTPPEILWNEYGYIDEAKLQ